MELPPNVRLNDDAELVAKLRNAMVKNGGPNLGLVIRRSHAIGGVAHKCLAGRQSE